MANANITFLISILFSLLSCIASQSGSYESQHNEQRTNISKIVNDSGLEEYTDITLHTTTEDQNTLNDVLYDSPEKSHLTGKSEFSGRKTLDCFNCENPLTAYIQEHLLEIDGFTYLDIGAYDKLALEIRRLPSHVGKVNGITVVDGSKCVLRFLKLSQGYMLSENITKCNSLTNVTLAGSGWFCKLDWTWLDTLNLKNRWHIDYATAKCSDVKSRKQDNSYGVKALKFADGRRIWKNSDLGVCPKFCQCFILTNTERRFEELKVRCNKLNITDEDILSMPIPSQTTSISLEGNRLRSTESIFRHISHLQSVTVISLNHNELTEVPYLPKGKFLKLKQLDLINNKIRKINPEAFESIVSRDGIWVDVHQNDFLCDCNAHFFMKLVLQYPEKVKDYIDPPFRCTLKPGDVPVLITLRTEECEPTATEFNGLPILISLLILLNAAFIYFLWDLYKAIKECRNTFSIHDPIVHIIVKKIGKFVSNVFQQNDTAAEMSSSTEDLQEGIPMNLRNRRTSSA